MTAGWAIKQIALPLSLDRQFSFDNFFGDQAELLVDSLQALIVGQGENQIGVHGVAGSGKTHLLNACAHYARNRQVRFHLYDGLQLNALDASEFEGFDQCDVLAVDNLDAIAGDRAWESLFYQIINRCRDGEYRFVFTLSGLPGFLDLKLEDLRSRLQWGLLLEAPSSDDEAVRDILTKRAQLMGIELSAEVVSYLLTHHSRDLTVQMAILRTLDGASLSQRRKVTIPLIKQALAD
ncbi:MAG: DnaA regulatory inactivator Hda [Pseudomonadota bacterium]